MAPKIIVTDQHKKKVVAAIRNGATNVGQIARQIEMSHRWAQAICDVLVKENNAYGIHDLYNKLAPEPNATPEPRQRKPLSLYIDKQSKAEQTASNLMDLFTEAWFLEFCEAGLRELVRRHRDAARAVALLKQIEAQREQGEG